MLTLCSRPGILKTRSPSIADRRITTPMHTDRRESIGCDAVKITKV
ncbi:MAG: hypothetical protein V7L01_05035 [Nostoc sp.]